jgi:CHAT domain-containing protein/tetratricopeptide (TPR) repeat protein
MSGGGTISVPRGGVHPVLGRAGFILLVVLCLPAFAQDGRDPYKLVQEADRLAWLRAWTRAAPLYADAERLFAARGDRRNLLYAQVSKLRGDLPHLPVPDVSQRLAEYLDDPVVQGDDRLRLRCLIIKGETDEDLDPSISQQSWQEAARLAEKLGEPAWANRAQGELGLVAFLLGDINNSVVRLGQALKTAESNGDVSSVVRWLTLFGHGYVELGRSEQALEFYDRALKIAATVPELQFPLMTYLGRGDALARLGRFEEAERLLDAGLIVARRENALGYQAELTLKKGLIAYGRKQTDSALALLMTAADLARQAGGNRILAEISLELARIQRASGRPSEADRTLGDGIEKARSMGERLLLPRLLAQQADLRASQSRYTEASNLLAEATDLLEGLLTNASSPWARSRVISGMDDVLLARVRLEGLRGRNPERLFSALEQAKGRSLLELLLSTPLGDVAKSPELRAGERRIASLQSRLLRTANRPERERLLNEIFVAEEQMAPAATALFTHSRAVARRPVLQDVQRALRADEVLIDFALAEPSSYAVIVSRERARIQRLPGQGTVQRSVEALMQAVHAGLDVDEHAKNVGQTLLAGIPELANHARIVVSPDGDLHRLPFELLVSASGRRLLETHVVSYVPSGSVLSVLRERRVESVPRRATLAISASPLSDAPARATNGDSAHVERGVYDLDISKLPPLPSANDEARSAASALGSNQSTVLLADSATELELKKQSLHEYRVMHFAVHGIVSTTFPARSALVLRPAGTEDGLLQAREILTLRLAADLVTLSACDSGTGTVHGHEGVASLVRPFLSAGGRTVVANLWTADDRFSLGLMREFYRHVSAGKDIASALRQAKLTMVDQYGPRAAARLWSGVLVYGDGAGTVKVPVPESN